MAICESCLHKKRCPFSECDVRKCRDYLQNTEENYLRSCDTEQLAELIVNITLLDKYKLYDRFEFAEYEQGIGVGAKQEAMLWLKQPHHEKGVEE